MKQLNSLIFLRFHRRRNSSKSTHNPPYAHKPRYNIKLINYYFVILFYFEFGSYELYSRLLNIIDRAHKLMYVIGCFE